MQRAVPDGIPVATGRVIGGLLAAFEACGVDRSAVLSRSGLDPDVVGAPDRRITHRQAETFWAAARDLSGDPRIGLHAAQQVDPAALDVIAYLAGASETGRDAIDRVRGVLGVLHAGIEIGLEFDEHGEHAVIGYRHRGGVPVCANSTEFTAGLIVRLSRELGSVTEPVEVRFVHAGPEDAAAHVAELGAPVRFGAAHNAVVFERAQLERPLAGRDGKLADILERHARDLLERLPSADPSVAGRLRTLLDERLAERPDLSKAAACLGMGARTLRRHLAEEGTSFRRVLDDLRRDRAAVLLADPELPRDAVAYLLGYSDASALHKALRRWQEPDRSPSGPS